MTIRMASILKCFASSNVLIFVVDLSGFLGVVRVIVDSFCDS